VRVDLVPVPAILLDRLASLGVDVEHVLRLAGLAGSRFQPPKARLTTSEFFGLWRAVESVADAPDFGLRLGATRLPHQYDVVSMAALHSPSLDEALKKLARYKRLVCPEQVVVDVAEGEARVQFVWELADSNPPRFLIDATFAGTLDLARSGTGKPIVARRIELTRRRNDEAVLTRHFACQVRFDAPVDLLVFDEAALSERFVTHNSDVLSLLLSGLEGALREEVAGRSLADDVRVALRRSMSGERPSVDRIGKQLGMSSRTLQRRLEGEGATYQGLLDEVRRESARRLLANTDVDPEEVAFLLGFEEANSFTRAFQAWEGTTPKQWRGAGRKIARPPS
jgi:AraC-like DNA-binding protein